MARSAEAVTPVEIDEVLFAALGSAVVDETLAVLVSDPACAGAVTTTVMVGAVAPLARLGRVQVTEVLPTLLHVQPAPVPETKVTPAGSVSATETFAASEGPLFATTREYETDPAAVTEGGPVFVIERSAEAVTVVVAEEVLFVATGSAVVDDTLAVFVSEPAWPGAVTTSAIVGAVAPDASVGRVHVTDTFPVLVQVHPVPAADTKLTPAGSASVRDTLAASDGPALEATRL
jgi:hypothetical protein